MNNNELKSKLQDLGVNYVEYFALTSQTAKRELKEDGFLVTSRKYSCSKCDDAFDEDEIIKYKILTTKKGTQWIGKCKRCKRHFLD